MRVLILAAALAIGALQEPIMAANDLTIQTARQASNEWSVVVPANTTSVQVDVPYDVTEWGVTPHAITITITDANGVRLWGGNPNTGIVLDKFTGMPRPFHEGFVMGFEPEATFPVDRKMLSAFTIDGVKYRQVGIFSPMTVRVDVDNGVPGAQLTYGVLVTLGTKTQRATSVP